jgi:hypothetical protein
MCGHVFRSVVRRSLYTGSLTGVLTQTDRVVHLHLWSSTIRNKESMTRPVYVVLNVTGGGKRSV